MTASEEYGDIEVSWERINASVPSSTADVISSASYVLHCELLTIESNSCDYMRTGLPSLLHL